MKTTLPDDHGLPPRLLKTCLLRQVKGTWSLTDVQHAALEHGVGRGASALIVAPTSSGKTDVGLLAAASWLESGDQLSRRVVYLASHRALARQKYLELRKPELLQALAIDSSQLILATGDEVIDGAGDPNQEPLEGTFVIATYEKFLALLAGSGLRQDMTHYCVIADEIQLIGDEKRGQDLEILLTLVKAAKFGQFIGLSAVLHKRDHSHLAAWLQVHTICIVDREVPLTLELRAPKAVHRITLGSNERVETKEGVRSGETLEILKELAKKPAAHCPVAVFCMTKARVEILARAWAQHTGAAKNAKSPVQTDLFDEMSGMSNDLLLYVDKRFGVHTADLLETERALVEDQLDRDNLVVVFATTTLAQGMNYSFQTVIFDEWWRWNRARQSEDAIPKYEFHNMAGRAGRLGKSSGSDGGRAIFSADHRRIRAASQYLTSETDPMLQGRIDPSRFDQLALQIVSAGIVDSSEDLLAFLGQTLSAHIAKESNRKLDAYWGDQLRNALTNLQSWGFVGT